MAKRKPRCIVIAGPNGAGKTTFAKEFLPKEAGILHFVNADLIAAGLSPLDPAAAQVAAARILLKELDRLSGERKDFAFETTLSGRAYLDRIREWRMAGYRVELVFVRVRSAELLLKRIALRVKQGGHDVPATDVLRRIERGWFAMEGYLKLADSWAVYGTEGEEPQLIAEHNGEQMRVAQRRVQYSKDVRNALRRAAAAAREVARMHGTRIAVMKDGKVVLMKP
ncbi:MAG TPA: zeta toxin family protein [Flavobacteriales bacterium]|nr:zeta toxin family protein [Flavobacteriales bacterium]